MAAGLKGKEVAMKGQVSGKTTSMVDLLETLSVLLGIIIGGYSLSLHSGQVQFSSVQFGCGAPCHSGWPFGLVLVCPFTQDYHLVWPLVCPFTQDYQLLWFVVCPFTQDYWLLWFMVRPFTQDDLWFGVTVSTCPFTRDDCQCFPGSAVPFHTCCG